MESVKIELYGALKKYPSFTLLLERENTAQDVKSKILQHLERDHGTSEELILLLEHSAIATESKILQLKEPIGVLQRLAVLPPVCGG